MTDTILTRVTGIADEAGPGISTQIAAHQAIGWGSIELRTIDGVSVTQLKDADFDRVYGQLEDAGMRCAGFASAIANWARPITNPFETDIDDLERSIPRMRRMNTRLIRIMSYPQGEADEKHWREEAFKRMGELVKRAEDAGIVLLLENCDGWASQSPKHFEEMLAHFSSPALRVVFDSGNAIAHGGTREDNWAFYRASLPYLDHFHIKDCKLNNAGYTMPGEGDCDVEALITDVLKQGYQGMFSIEPHIAMVIHEGDGATAKENQQEGYQRYGEMANQLAQRAQKAANSN